MTKKNVNCLGTNTDEFGQLYNVNCELREKFPNSYFFPDGYDDDIIGVNTLTGSIIYNWWSIGFSFIDHCEGSFPDYGDRVYGCNRMTKWLKTLTPEELQGKVPPTIIMVYGETFLETWDDRNHFFPDEVPL